MSFFDMEIFNASIEWPASLTIRAGDISRLTQCVDGKHLLTRLDADIPNKDVSIYLDNAASFTARHAYSSAGYDAFDDPIAKPATALARAAWGMQSQGLDEQAVVRVLSEYLTDKELAVARFFANHAAANAPAGLTTRKAPAP